jgi:hypothetical protein
MPLKVWKAFDHGKEIDIQIISLGCSIPITLTGMNFFNLTMEAFGRVCEAYIYSTSFCCDKTHLNIDYKSNKNNLVLGLQRCPGLLHCAVADSLSAKSSTDFIFSQRRVINGF